MDSEKMLENIVELQMNTIIESIELLSRKDYVIEGEIDPAVSTYFHRNGLLKGVGKDSRRDGYSVVTDAGRTFYDEVRKTSLYQKLVKK